MKDRKSYVSRTVINNKYQRFTRTIKQNSLKSPTYSENTNPQNIVCELEYKYKQKFLCKNGDTHKV